MVKKRPIITNPNNIRQAIFDNTKKAIKSKFPIDTPSYRIDLKNIEIKHSHLSYNRQRKIIMAKGNASDGVMVDVNLVDKGTGKIVLALKNHRLMNLPYFTDRYTFILSGVEYNIVNQLRTKSGVYTRKRGNDTLEASFNLEKGANFRMTMDPESGLFKIDILHSVLPMFAVLKAMNADMNKARQILGNDLYSKNNNITDAAMKRTVDTLYNKLVRYRTELKDTASQDEKMFHVRQYFSNTKIDPETTKITLGEPHTNVGVSTLLAAAEKIIQVYKGNEDTDERDSLEFQKIFSVEDIVKEVIDKSKYEIEKIKSRLNRFKPTGDPKTDRENLKSVLSPVYFSQPLRNFIIGSSISRTPTHINMMEVKDANATVTRLGEGAIRSDHAVPESSRAVNYSYMGVIDPFAGPESSKIGIDNRFTIRAYKGENNELYKIVTKMDGSGRTTLKRLIKLHDKYVGMPDELHKKGKTKPSDIVPAIYKGKLVKVRRDKLDFQIPTPHDLSTLTMNALPFVNSNQGNRLVMGSKHVTQAMPLLHRDNRLVIASTPSVGETSTIHATGRWLEPHAPEDGTIKKIDDDYIYLLDKDGKTHKIDYLNNLPLASKTMFNNNLTVKKGDKVKKGQSLGTSNFTKNGKEALGKNLRVAYMPYHGLNHEDGIVISESASEKLTSVHSDRVVVTMDANTIVDKNKFESQFPVKFTKDQLAKLDDSGIAKKNIMLESGDPIILVMADNANSRANQVLGNLHKSLIRPYRDASEVYDEKYPAKVVETMRSGKTITVLLRVEKPAGIGDKLAGSYGNKGVISHIEKDENMPFDEDGNKMDAILTSAGVSSRINPAQILETSLGKIADKTGKPYLVENFEHENNFEFVANELKKHKVKDKNTLTDPITGKKIPGIFTGVQHIHKLFKTTDTNFSGRGVEGSHDQDDAPVGSGMEGPKGIGGMEVNALISHNARAILKEGSTIRNQKNREFWSQFQSGGYPSMPIEKKTFNKFVSVLGQAGIKVDRQGNELVAGPMTDKDVLEMSSGRIRNAKRIDAKLMPESGGLFDDVITGGMKGTKWSHIKLSEPVLNPIFEKAAIALLDISSKDLERELMENGGKEIRKRLNAIDISKELSDAKRKTKDPKIKGASLDKLVKKIKYLNALKEKGLKPGDAYIIQNIPVTPPAMRPITVGVSGDKLENDANLLYRNLILENDTFSKIRNEPSMAKETRESRLSIQNRVRELAGTIAPKEIQLRNAGVKGAIKFISGDQPKTGFFQNKVIYSKMNLAGRATVRPDNTLGLDEVGMPEDMAWAMYKPFLLRKLAQMGYGSIQSREEVENRSDTAKKILIQEMERRPLIINRAPTLWKHGILAAKPSLRSGKSISVNSLWEKALGMDYDGDAVSVHLPITDDGIKDAERMMPSKSLFSGKRRNDLLPVPSMEPIGGLYKATVNVKKVMSGPVHKYRSEADAWKDYYSGKLKSTDLVEIG